LIVVREAAWNQLLQSREFEMPRMNFDTPRALTARRTKNFPPAQEKNR
jgi:hypothetical protein